ncbi:Fc.00g084490.m01.CDS01 [Cosmosporella sp. VM-42]
MVRILSSALAAATLLGLAQASPVEHPVANEPTFKNLLGFDEKKNRKAKTSDVIPEVKVLTDFTFNKTAESVEPLVISEEDLQKRFINGGDERYQFTSNDYPYPATGKLQWSNGVFCSGALVGPRHVLTAKHCLVSGASGKFSPRFDNGEPFGSGQVTVAVTSGYEWGTPCGWKGDWAILILDQRLGERVGYFGAKLPDHSLVDRAIFDHVGYPGDRDNGNRPYRTNGNPIQGFRSNWDCDANGPYYTDTDCMGGQSGGAHWESTSNGPMIWGTLSVTFDGGNGVAWAGWGSGNEMLDAIIRLRNEYP